MAVFILMAAVLYWRPGRVFLARLCQFETQMNADERR